MNKYPSDEIITKILIRIGYIKISYIINKYDYFTLSMY